MTVYDFGCGEARIGRVADPGAPSGDDWREKSVSVVGTSSPDKPSPARIAELLVALEGTPFGGKPGGRFRVSRKFLRQFAERRRLPPALVEAIADEMFERGFVLIDMESYFVVIPQRYFSSYRRVTAAAAERVRMGDDRVGHDAIEPSGSSD